MFSDPMVAIVGVVAASCSIEVSPELMKEHSWTSKVNWVHRNLRCEVRLGQWQETR
jgi:hypothetical protein